MKAKYDVTKHTLVPKHTKISEKEKKELLERYNIALNQLPCILKSDPAIDHLNADDGDVIKITRSSPTAGETLFYRRVING